MKIRVFIGCMVVAAVAASAAVAAPSKGKPPTTGPGCKPEISVVLKGTLAANGAAAPFTLMLTVTGGNHFAKAYKAATQPVSISVTTTTKVNRQGDTNSADLKSGDRAVVTARVCKANLANGATPALTATRVTAHPAS